ncbi:MAG: hypothetical protein ACREMO_10175 [Gemmatimonadales bacterium]
MLRQKSIVWALFVAWAGTACKEKLTAPADCPGQCPGGEVVLDTVLAPLQDQDSSFSGYVRNGQGTSLRISDQLPASEDRAVFRFLDRPDVVPVPGDSSFPYTVDSVRFEFSLLARDTAVKSLGLFLYRLRALPDSTVTFAPVEDSLITANLIDSLLVPDTVATGRLRVVVSGAALSQLDLSGAPTRELGLGLKIQAASPTGIRIASNLNLSLAPQFITFVTAATPDTASRHRTITRGSAFSTFVSQTAPVLDDTLLTVGGAPSARALLRFVLPPKIRDSAILVRATLELIPVAPVQGLPNDPGQLEARAVLADFGIKSALSSTGVGDVAISDGLADTLRVEVVGVVRSWQGTDPFPAAIALLLNPEGSSFSRAVFGSTRSAAAQPRLRITYTLPFSFERP